jgi:hypothetical protein
MVTKTVINRDNEAERQRRVEGARLVANFLLPSGSRKDTSLYRAKEGLKQRLKNNPRMTAVLTSLLLAGGGVMGYAAYKESRPNRRKTKRRKTKRKY